MCNWVSHCPKTWVNITEAPCTVIRNFNIWQDCERVQEWVRTEIPNIIRYKGWVGDTSRAFFSTWWTREI